MASNNLEMEPGEIVSSPEPDVCDKEKETGTETIENFDSSNVNSSGIHFTVDRTCIPTVSQAEQENELCGLGIEVYQQEVLEKEILHQVDKAFEYQKQKKAEELATKMEDKLKKQKRVRKTDEPEKKEENINEEKKEEPVELITPEETERERKIRMGEMTPFGTVVSLKMIERNNLENIEKYLRQQVEIQKERKSFKKKQISTESKSPKKSPNKISVLKKNDFFPKKRKKKEKLGSKISENEGEDLKSPEKLLSEVTPMETSGSEYLPEDTDSEDGDFNLKPKRKKKKPVKKGSDEEISAGSDVEYSDDKKNTMKGIKGMKEIDDGDEENYLWRLEDWEKKNSREEIETQVRCLDDGFKIPLIIWNKLYNYQRVGVQWLWELNLQRCGGILGDEMGLGKTVQVISFLASLSVSKLLSRHGSFRGLGPVLIVCPTTVMHQWVREFHKWWPQFRVALLHESGTFKGEKHSLIRDIAKGNGILITSYITCTQQSNNLLRYTWHYVILDEGHKIRNPESQIASTVKMFRTPHRLILSGSPMQNNLKELWSLFDFIFPGKLGTLPVFMAELGVPITQGGYANASDVQVATAYKCATVLRDTISPYLLRRAKDDVKSHINLPPKNEQVLFCRLTDEQKELYVSYLNGGRVDDILSGKYKIFVGLIELRQICNHPHLFTGGPKLFKWDNPDSMPEEERFGYWKKAGKMIVVETLLKIWKKQGHRVLIFSQSRKMLRILEAFVQSQKYEYIKIDGSTNIGSRQPLINKFNEDKKYYIFLSTTHVGGLGVNLTGANRVIIYDPDWNPATDMQARERAWRIGQENQVTIYRLVTSGTIEEKIYHRQIFKQFLTNKVLKDPSQRRFFKSNDLYELFTYKDSDNLTETSAIFAGTGFEVNLKNLSHRQKVKKIKEKMSLEKSSMKEAVDARNVLTKEKIEKMKQMAQSLSRKIALESRGKKEKEVEDGSEKNTEKDVKPSSEKSEESSYNGKEETRKEKRKKHKKKKRKDAMFEGETVPHLNKEMQYRDLVKEATGHESNDDYILKKLFSKSGVQSALRHDQIMEEEAKDYALIEGEAEKVAKEAVKALKESRKQYMRSFEESQVKTLSKPRFGRKTFGQKAAISIDETDGKNTPMTSAELLQRIRQRNGLCPASDTPLNEHSELLTDIRNFISFGAETESKATTQEIVDRFRNRLPAGQTPLFKALLNEICEFRRTSTGEGPKNPSVKGLVSGSLESEVGECESYWLLCPPFDQRDYMISPSESPAASVKEKVEEKLGPKDIKIDPKYILDSNKVLKKLLDLIKDGCAPKITERLKDLLCRYLQGTPPGFILEDLPSVIELVEYFSRNREAAPEFTDFVKAIMSRAKEPPKLGKSSDILRYKDAMIDYFTLFGELLATFEDGCFQLRLLESIDCLLMRRNLVDVSCVKLSVCHEAMEKSQLPSVVVSLIETVSSSLYFHYLDLALQMVLISMKAGQAMVKCNLLDFVLSRLEPFTIEKKCQEYVDEEAKLYNYYKVLDKCSHLIWVLLGITPRHDAEVPIPGEKALRSLRKVFEQEARTQTPKAKDTRNNLAGIIVKLCALFGKNLPLFRSGLAVDIAALSVALEIEAKESWVAHVKFGSCKEDYILKKLMLLGCCLMGKNNLLMEIIRNQRVIEGVLRMINPTLHNPWSSSQFIVLFCIALRTLSELVPELPEEFVKNKGSAKLLDAIKWLKENNLNEDALLETVKTFGILATCANNKSLIEDLKTQNGVHVLLDLCFYVLKMQSLKMKQQEQLARVFLVLERLLLNDVKLQTSFGESCVNVSVMLLKRMVEDSEHDSKWNPSLAISFGAFLWEAVVWYQPSLQSFVEKGGVFLLLDFIEPRCLPIQMFFLGILVDMTDGGEAVSHLLTWRGKDGYGLLNMMIDVWRKEEISNKVHRSPEGFILELDAPLMTEEQWFLTHHSRGSYLYSPSVAEMMCSVRPKIHALYQLLNHRYFTLTKRGEEAYNLQMKRVKSSHQVYIPLVEHYLAMKLGEIWEEVIRDANYSGVFPTKFDGEVICTLLDERNKWAARIRTMQEEIALSREGCDAAEEKEFYSFLKYCRLHPALEALRDLSYVARCSFKHFQIQKKDKQIKEVKDSLLALEPDNDNFHRTFMPNTNATCFAGYHIWIKSEKEVSDKVDDILLVSPLSSEGRAPRFDDVS